MRRLRRHRLAIAAVLLAAIGAVLVLFALDVRTWQRTVARDDLRFRALPDHPGLWKPQTILPWDPAGAALGTGDTLAWRRAASEFWYTRVGSNPDAHEDVPTMRAKDANWLASLAQTGSSAHERSAAANLLGVLIVSTPVPGNDQDVITKVLQQAAQTFQAAIAIDPADADAKENLELVLRVVQPGRGRLGQDARAGYGLGRGRGATQTGSGY
jgi:hypothetical protein